MQHTISSRTQLTSKTCGRIAAGVIFSLSSVPHASALDLTNESTRAFVGTGDDRMVLGFVAEGSDTQQFTLFAVGPELEESGVSGVLPDPKITLYNSSGGEIDSNDNWKDHPSAGLTNEFLNEAGLSLDDVEAAMVLDLGAGSYTLVVEGVGGTTGSALGGVFKTDVSAPEPPPGTDASNVCSQDLCATSAIAAGQCQDFLDVCLATEFREDDECVAGARLFCGEL